MTTRRVIIGAVLVCLLTTAAGVADESTGITAHCGFLSDLAQFDLGLHNIGAEDALGRDHLAAAVGRLRQQIRAFRVADAFSDLEVLQVEAYLAAQQRALWIRGGGAAPLRHARIQHPLPWGGQVFAQKLALCEAQGGDVRPIDTGAGTGDQDGTGGASALTSQLRIPLGPATLRADHSTMLILVLVTICLALILRALVGSSQRRSRRIYCYVPVVYATGAKLRQGWLLDLSSHGCKLRTQGESWEAGATIRIYAGGLDLRGTIAWTSLNYAGVALQRELDPAQVERIAFAGTEGALSAE